MKRHRYRYTTRSLATGKLRADEFCADDREEAETYATARVARYDGRRELVSVERLSDSQMPRSMPRDERWLGL